MKLVCDYLLFMFFHLNFIIINFFIKLIQNQLLLK